MNDILKEEMETLKSIYNEDFHEVNDNSFEIKVKSNINDERWLMVSIRCEEDYPATVPVLSLSVQNRFSNQEFRTLQDSFAALGRELLGSPMLFSLIQAVQEALDVEKKEETETTYS